MFTSFIKLPEFAAKGTVIWGSLTDERPEMYDYNDDETPGRCITVDAANKYKAQFVNFRENRVYHIVYLSPEDFTVTHGTLPENKIIVPIYFRVYPIDAKEGAGKCYLYIPGINYVLVNWFKYPPVISFATLIQKILMNCAFGDDPDTYIPDEILNNKLDDDFGTNYTVSFSTLTGAMGYHFNGSENYRYLKEAAVEAGVHEGMISLYFKRILERWNTSLIKDLFDPHQLMTDPVMLQTRAIEDMLPQYYSLIHSSSNEGSRYANHERYVNGKVLGSSDIIDGYTVRRLLQIVSTYPTSDFVLQYICDPRHPDIAAREISLLGRTSYLGDGANRSCINLTNRRYAWDLVSDMINEIDVNSGEYNYLSGSIHGSYYEDLWVYNPDGSLNAYIDLVWWTLASSSGLFPEYIIQ